ncbi:MAG: hypothetical protein HC805_03150 [Alkalinema sp. RL_2_19]|nr:hypothetical protein [Alkalinema sp. RL_2_19]
MLEINPTYVFDAQHQPVAVHISIAQFQQIEAILKETGYLVEVKVASSRSEDIAWLDADLAPDLASEPYDWQEGELEAGQAVQVVPGMGIVVAG